MKQEEERDQKIPHFIRKKKKSVKTASPQKLQNAGDQKNRWWLTFCLNQTILEPQPPTWSLWYRLCPGQALFQSLSSHCFSMLAVLVTFLRSWCVAHFICITIYKQSIHITILNISLSFLCLLKKLWEITGKLPYLTIQKQ